MLLNKANLNQLAETVSLMGTVASGIVLVGSFFFSNPFVSSVATASAIGCGISLKGSKRSNDLEQLRAERDSLRQSMTSLQNDLATARNRLTNDLKQCQTYYESQISQLRSEADSRSELETKYQLVKQQFEDRASQLKSALATIAQFEQKSQSWQQSFDVQIRELEQKDVSIKSLESELNRYRAQFASIEEVAKLRAETEARMISDKLKELESKYLQTVTDFKATATQYNAIKSQFLAQIEEYRTESEEFSQAVQKDIPDAFQGVLDERDNLLITASRRISELEAPQLFEAIGEYDRANRLIKHLWESESRLCLDASEIVPYSDATGFDVFFNLRDRKARGQAFIDSLNDQGNALSIVCGCIKDLKFEYDRVNPHRIKTAMVFRKVAKNSVQSVEKLWISSAQFESKLSKLLKKPMTRVMGSTGEGKGIFVNLLLAIEAKQTHPAVTRLHDPMDGSAEDYWQVSKVSTDKQETKRAVKSFVKEFNQRLEMKVSTPATLDIFDEIDIVADTDSSINKDFLNCSKGMRHNGMRAYIIGQSPSVGKKGFEWADMDNFNAVYFGSAIKTAIDKNPMLEDKKESMMKTYSTLRTFCESKNEELGLSGANECRIGLLVTGGKHHFFELPSADSIVCDWSRLKSEVPTEDIAEVPNSVETVDSLKCPHCGSNDVKKDGKNRQGKQQYRCKNTECNKRFQSDL